MTVLCRIMLIFNIAVIFNTETCSRFHLSSIYRLFLQEKLLSKPKFFIILAELKEAIPVKLFNVRARITFSYLASALGCPHVWASESLMKSKTWVCYLEIHKPLTKPIKAPKPTYSFWEGENTWEASAFGARAFLCHFWCVLPWPCRWASCFITEPSLGAAVLWAVWQEQSGREESERKKILHAGIAEGRGASLGGEAQSSVCFSGGNRGAAVTQGSHTLCVAGIFVLTRIYSFWGLWSWISLDAVQTLIWHCPVDMANTSPAWCFISLPIFVLHETQRVISAALLFQVPREYVLPTHLLKEMYSLSFLPFLCRTSCSEAAVQCWSAQVPLSALLLYTLCVTTIAL